MQWQPNEEGVDELIKLFKESRGNNNEKHREIFEKINQYSKNKEFVNYLLFILNQEKLHEDIRQVSGLTLKGIMERQFQDFEEEELEYFKQNVLKSYMDNNFIIRKTISNLINTFLRNGGLEMWPEILEILFQNLDSDLGVAMSLETLIIIIEDSGSLIEEKYTDFLVNLTYKLTNYLEMTGLNNNYENSCLINLVLTTLHIILENCANSISENSLLEGISKALISIANTKNISIRYRVGRCWLIMIKLNKEILLTLSNTLFSFFSDNLSVENYEMNFTASEFFLYLIEEENGEYLKNKEISRNFESNMKTLTSYFFHYARMTNNDISGEELENRHCNSSQGKSGRSKSKCTSSVDDNGNNEEDNSSVSEEIDNKFEEEIFEDEIETYNANWTLRKCSSKLLDKLSHLFPEAVIANLVPLLETEIQHKDWIIKERSILVLGAIGIGSYQQLKPNLANLVQYLIGELSNSNKLVRAICCWTLSRLADFILTENNETLLRLYLSALLKSFLDKDSIVQEAACTSFNQIIQLHKEKLSPYLADVLKIITSIFENYKGNSLLSLYDCITLLAENFEEEFTNLQLIQDLLMCIIKKWYELMNIVKESNTNSNANTNSKTNSNNNLLSDVTCINFFDVLISIIKSSGVLLQNYFLDFFNGCLSIIRNYKDDKEVLCKCLDLVSVLCQVFPEQVKENPNKFLIVEVIFNLIKTENDLELKQYVLALIGDLCKVDTMLLKSNLDFIIQILIENIKLTSNKNKQDLNLISVCNNSCWALGVLTIAFKDKMMVYTAPIIEILLEIISAPKLNKSLAQNVAICIGRLGLINPTEVSKYLPSFIKQFCLSVKLISDSQEKQEAYSGLCQAIIINPNGVLGHFAFFCDAVSQFANAPQDLENLFQKIVMSYKELLREEWCTYFNIFPEKLRNKMKNRFLFLKRNLDT